MSKEKKQSAEAAVRDIRRRTPPGIGQHTEEALQELEFDDAAIQGLPGAKPGV
jgi:hypothetical protein